MHPNNIVQHIKDTVDIVDIISKYVALEPRSGGTYWGLSPFKSEKTPSFTVNPEKNIYYCFSTSQGGDIFTFIQKMEHVDFMGAVRIITQTMGIVLEENSKDSSFSHNSDDAKIMELCTKITNTFSYFLEREQGRVAKRYIKGRNFSDAILKSFHIGYIIDDPKWLYSFLSSKHYTKTQLKESGLFSKNYENYPLFRNRLIFPIQSPSGQVVAFGGRILQGEGPKYINSPETKFFKKKNNLYGMYQCKQVNGFKAKKAYLVEGYIDVIAMHDADIPCAVAPLGTAFTIEQAQILKRHADTIVLLFDNDEAGLNAAVQSAVICETIECKAIKIVVLSENDPADVFSKHGKEELRSQINKEIDFFDYYLAYVLGDKNLNMQEKESGLFRILDYIKSVQAMYRKAVYVSKTAEALQIPEANVYASLEKIISKASYRATRVKETSVAKNEERRSSISIKKTNEMFSMVALCSTLTQNVVTFEHFRSNILLSDLEDKHARFLFTTLEEAYRNNSLSFESVLEKLPNEYKDFIQMHIASGEIANNRAMDVIQAFINAIKIKRLTQQGKEIEHKLRIYNNNNTGYQHARSHSLMQGFNENTYIDNKESKNQNILQGLLAEKKRINKEISQLLHDK